MMQLLHKTLVSTVWIASFAAASIAFAAPGDGRHWQPVEDDVFLQEVGRQVATSHPLTSVAVYDEHVYVGSERGLFKLESNELQPVESFSRSVHRLVAAGDALWAITDQGLYRFPGDTWLKLEGPQATDLTEHLGQIIVSSGRRLFRVVDNALVPLVDAESPFPITRVISHCETLYVHGKGRLTYYDGDRIGARNVFQWASDKTWDWGRLPSQTTRDALSQAGRLYIATDRGLALLRGMSLTSIRGEDGLCYEDTTCLANGFDNDLWIGTTRGAIRMVDGQFHYFAGRRWLPTEQVNAIATGKNAVYIATSKGLGIVEYEPYTLQKKADYYERHLDQWGQRRLGFTHKLEWDKELKQYVREVSDNDGGYSGNYLAAQAYRFAVTKDLVARAEAVNTFAGLRWLETMTPIPGFIARSVWAKGEVGHQADHGSGGAPAEWHDTADGNL